MSARDALRTWLDESDWVSGPDPEVSASAMRMTPASMMVGRAADWTHGYFDDPDAGRIMVRSDGLFAGIVPNP